MLIGEELLANQCGKVLHKGGECQLLPGREPLQNFQGYGHCPFGYPHIDALPDQHGIEAFVFTAMDSFLAHETGYLSLQVRVADLITKMAYRLHEETFARREKPREHGNKGGSGGVICHRVTGRLIRQTEIKLSWRNTHTCAAKLAGFPREFRS